MAGPDLNQQPARAPGQGRIRQAYYQFAPAGTRRRRAIGMVLFPFRRLLQMCRRRRNRPQPRLTYPDAQALESQRRTARSWSEPAVLHAVVVEDGQGDPEVTLASLRKQTWAAVEVTRVSADHLADKFSHLAEQHPEAPVVLLRAGDRLRPDAAYEVCTLLWRDPAVQLVYWDDDLSGRAPFRIRSPRIKPGWSPDLLSCVNYIGRSFALRARHLNPAACRWPLTDDSLWWALLLSADLHQQHVARLPVVLQYVGRRYEEVDERHLDLLDGWLRRHGWPADAAVGPAGLVPEWHAAGLPSVSVIVPTRHNRAFMQGAVALLREALRQPVAPPEAELIVVDNGERNPANEAWYDETLVGLSHQVIWWDEPFNYSAVNNHAAELATGDVLVFLNDDTGLGHPGWLANVAGWAARDEIGVAGLQLIGDNGRIQHGGVILGLHGLADHLFAGKRPHSSSLMGSTDWTRNMLATTGACLAVRRSVFEEVGGFEECMQLCGSDVVLGLQAAHVSYRNVVSAATPIRHLECATRNYFVPEGDVYISHWHYQRWLLGGDPYFSPNLSLEWADPTLGHLNELTPRQHLERILNRDFTVFSQRFESAQSRVWTQVCNADAEAVEAVRSQHRALSGHHQVDTLNWFVPELEDSPHYGGINTVFRIADHLARHHGVRNRFQVVGSPGGAPRELWFRSALAATFPGLEDSDLAFHDYLTFDPQQVPPADAAMATLWTTAYMVAHTPGQGRKFYLVQDFEPGFHPAGTDYALAEQTYRLGLYGLCNTGHLADLYQQRYGGQAGFFWPAVDDRIFHARGRPEPDVERPVTVFLYARPGHFRNCWELAERAMRLVKEQLGVGVRILAAGSWNSPESDDLHLSHLGQLNYRETGTLYRTCDIGIALTTSEHPSYLPLEFMACGATVVAFDNPAGDWLLRDDENCVRTPQTADGLASEVVALATDSPRRQRLAKQAQADIAARHASWEQNLASIYDYLCDPESGR